MRGKGPLFDGEQSLWRTLRLGYFGALVKKLNNQDNTHFPNFAGELAEHPGGYHQTNGRVDLSQAMDWFAKRSIKCSQAYLDFLSEIGPGEFFSGGLVVFPLEPGGPFDRANEKLPHGFRVEFFAFGYDGTTEGCYCMSKTGADDAIYWCNWQANQIQVLEKSFTTWIEEAPRKLFSKSVYAGYKKIKDIAGVRRVIEDRKRYQVRLLRYDKHLVRQHAKDFLPRYNHIVCAVRKLEDSSLRQLTFRVRRTGSSVGNDNVQYVTVSLPDIRRGEEVQVEAYVFDPFNVRFQEIIVEYSPDIDLGSPMHVRFSEIRDYL